MQFFEREGCKMVEMSCEEHDRQAASTQFITHTVGRVLGAMELQATPIDTRYADCPCSHSQCCTLSIYFTYQHHANQTLLLWSTIDVVSVLLYRIDLDPGSGWPCPVHAQPTAAL